MKFLEVKLCYLNTNLVQENFGRCAAASHPVAPPCPASAIFRRGCNQPLLKCSLLGTGSSLPHTPAHFPLGGAEKLPTLSPLALGCLSLLTLQATDVPLPGSRGTSR